MQKLMHIIMASLFLLTPIASSLAIAATTSEHGGQAVSAYAPPPAPIILALHWHSRWMREMEETFGNPQFITGNPLDEEKVREWYENTISTLDRPACESFFGKDFFTAFIAYHRHRGEAIAKTAIRDWASVMGALHKAKACAETMIGVPTKNKEALPRLFAEKTLLETRICIAATECMRGNAEAGLAALKDCRDEAAKLKWRWGRAQAAFYRAFLAHWTDLPSARPVVDTLFEEALAIAREDRVHYFLWKSSYGLAGRRFEQGQIESQIALTEEAIISIEFLRSKIMDDGTKYNSMSEKFGVYNSLTESLIQKGEFGKALEVIDGVKSCVLRDLLASSHKTNILGLETPLYMKEQALAEKIESLEEADEKEFAAPLAALRKAHEAIIAEIRKTNPDFAVLKVGLAADLEEMRSLLDDKTVLLEYMVLDNLRIGLLTKDSVQIKPTSLNFQTLMQKVQAMHMLMSKPNSPAVNKSLRQLYESIIKPFEKEIEGKNLILVPDGALYSLPFAALIDGQGRYLVENHTLSVVPSSSVLKYCRAKTKKAAKSILAFGNPDLADPKMDLPHAQWEVKNIAEHFPKLQPPLLMRSEGGSDLPRAQTEAAHIATKFPEAEVYLRQDATETLAKKMMGHFDVLHFACHAETKEYGNVMDSCLRLTPDEENDGKLTAEEIFNLTLNAQLVILSGCETARGAVLGAGEMVGLMRSFIYAGTPCVIASLWKVDDNATSVLMQHLYENLGSMGKAEALRAAQLATMKEKRHPYYWASFYLVGDGR